MAFPGMSGMGGMTGGIGRPGMDGDPLAAPPPSPTAMDPNGDGGTPMSLRGLMGGPSAVPSNQMPPEVLTGIVSASQQITSMLDSFAQVTPDKGATLAMIKDLLNQYLAELMGAGAGAMSPTASGPAYPGGGLTRGIAGPGAV